MNRKVLNKSFNISYITAFLCLIPALLFISRYMNLKPGVQLMLFGAVVFLLVLFVVWIISYRTLIIKTRISHKKK